MSRTFDRNPPFSGGPVYLCRKNEVTLGKAVDFVSPDLKLGFSPGEVDIGMMTLIFRYRSNPIHEVERCLEIRKGELFFNVVIVYYRPGIDLRNQRADLLSCQWRNAATARNTRLFS